VLVVLVVRVKRYFVLLPKHDTWKAERELPTRVLLTPWQLGPVVDSAVGDAVQLVRALPSLVRTLYCHGHFPPSFDKSEGSLFALYTKHISYYLYSYSDRRGLYLIEPVPN